MKSISRKASGLLLCVALLSVIMVRVAHTHDMWVDLKDYRPSKSTPAAISVASAHHFPAQADEIMGKDRVEKVVFLAPDGKVLPAVPQGDSQFQPEAPLQTQGTYMAVVTPQNGFASKTPEGYQRGKSRKDLPNVVECRYSEKHGKALLTLGTAGGDVFSKPLGHKMEIIPLKDPAALKEGDELPVKVLIEGQPARTYVYGTYAGFSNEPSTFAYTTYTDKDGVAKVKMIKNGTWLVLVKEEKPYSEPAVCDKLSYAASLTFQVR
jgi:uncharacterized GH25 family protein